MARDLPSLTDLSNMGDMLQWENDVSLAPLTIDFLLHLTVSFLGPPEMVGVLSVLSSSLLSVFRVIGAHISSVRTLDLCDYCLGLVYSTTLLLYHHLGDWSRGGDYQCNRSLLIKVWTSNIESNLYTLEKSSCFNHRTWIAYLKWWQAHGSFCCRSLQTALSRLQVEGFLCL